MKEKALKRYALLLIVILCLQEATNAAYRPRPNALQIIKDNKERTVTSDANAEHTSSRVKRGLVKLFLLGLTLGAVLASVAFEIALSIEGCCLTQKLVCSYNKEYKEVRERIKTDQTFINQVWTEADVKFTWIDHTNLQNEALWNQIERITETLQRIIYSISPKTVEAMIRFNDEVKKQVAAGNTTVANWSAEELTTAYQGYFTGDWKIAALVGTSYATWIGSLAWQMGRQINKVKQFQDWLVRLTKTFGKKIGKIFTNIKNSIYTKVGYNPKPKVNAVKDVKTKSKLSQTTKKRIKTVGSIILTAGLLGVEIWLTIEKVKGCQALESKLKEAVNGIKKDEKTILELKTNVTTYKASLDNIYTTKVKGEVMKTGVTTLLQQIHAIIANSSNPKDANLTKAVTSIEVFLRDINGANEENTFNLIKNLKEALQRVEFTFSCWKLKTDSLADIRTDCKTGYKDLRNIYDDVIKNDGTNSGACTTKENLPYTTYESVLASMKIYAADENFDLDCKLNNPTTLQNVCEDKCNKFTNDQIATRKKLTLQQVEKFIKKCPAKCPMNPKDKAEICGLKAKYGAAGIGIALYLKTPPVGIYTEEEVTDEFNAATLPCPTPAP